MRITSVGIFVAILLICIPMRLSAKVTGPCADCHIMHNSQNGSEVDENGPWPYLLTIIDSGTASTDVCVGCHSSATSQTVINNVPVVFNISEPVKPLAGGNFHWVVNNGDAYGHNVRGISAADATLNVAPGSTLIQSGCGASCHISLTLPDYDSSGDYNNGCEGCHQSVKHHADHPAGQPVAAQAGWYRFLSSPPGHMGVGGGGVYGIEDPDWELNADSSTHNIHFGASGIQPAAPDYFESISEFCAGCHFEFHSPGYARLGVDNGGGGSPWLRHPTDVLIPDSGEFASGKVISTPYDPTVPVGKPNLLSYNPSLIEDGDKVICLSCHVAHGSSHPDMLRWDYNTMIVGTSDSGAGTGCFKCHTDKDGI